MRGIKDLVQSNEFLRNKYVAGFNSRFIAPPAWLLFDQALLVEGMPVENPRSFVQRLNRLLAKAV